MAQPFAFPPPPPPPPKRDPSTDQSAHVYQRLHRGGGRGQGPSRGAHPQRGGNFRGRGRGNSSGIGAGHNHHVERGGGFRQQSRDQTGRAGSSISSIHRAAKRTHATAFSPNVNPVRRPSAPPAVPSFNVDIDSLLSKKAQVPEAHTIKTPSKRKSNILGLTPSHHMTESESEEDDDEARLAQLSNTDNLTFSHNGQTLSLRTPDEIAVWIAERKKRYPTNAKIEAAKKAAAEKKQAWERQRKEREEASKMKREERLQQRQEHEKQKIKQKMLARVTAQAKAAVAAQKDDGSQRAQTKAEKLRKEVEEATKRLKEAEDALKRIQDVETIMPNEPGNAVHEIADTRQTTNEISLADTGEVDRSAISSEYIKSVAEYDSEDEATSTSGSSDEDTASDTDSSPEEYSSKHTGPERKQASQTSLDTETSRPCRNYVKYGRCKYGKKCHYSHKIPQKDRDSRSKNQPTLGRRKGLYQIMVEKEDEEQQKRAVTAIIALGQRGLLKPEADVQ